jgi:thiamine-monophosphate kinase
MKLSELGEREIIKIFQKNLDKCEKMTVDLGDDASAYSLDEDHCLIVSTDIVSQREHIPREMSPRQIGMYVANINLSDLAAMGARPIGMTFSFGLPSDLREGFIVELAKGINQACREHDICVLGGDTKEMEEIVISGTALGTARKNYILTRSGAKVGDIICVTGNIGSAAAGFYCITNNIRIEKFIKAALEPKARIEEGMVLAEFASSCIDISDGLAFSLHEIARASGVGFVVYEDKIPHDKEIKEVSDKSNVSEREILFHKGGDYELLFTAPPNKIDNLERLATKATIIGKITDKGTKMVEANGKECELEPRGYESFKRY